MSASASMSRKTRLASAVSLTFKRTTRLGHHCASLVGAAAIVGALGLWLQPDWRASAAEAVQPLLSVAPLRDAAAGPGPAHAAPQAVVAAHAPVEPAQAGALGPRASGAATLQGPAAVPSLMPTPGAAPSLASLITPAMPSAPSLSMDSGIRRVAFQPGEAEVQRPPESLASADEGPVLASARVDERVVKSSRAQEQVLSYITNRYKVANSPIRRLVAAAFKTGSSSGVDPLLLLAVMAVESSFNPYAQSGVGAQGLMQVMPGVHSDKFAHFGGQDAALEPFANMQVGTQVLKDCLKRRGSLEGGLNCYVGATTADDGGYGARVIAERARLRAAVQGRRVTTVVASSTRKPASTTRVAASHDNERASPRHSGVIGDDGAPAQAHAEPFTLENASLG